jgi:hypothetical protein
MQNESEIADAIEASKLDRKDIFITSKIGPHQVHCNAYARCIPPSYHTVYGSNAAQSLHARSTGIADP